MQRVVERLRKLDVGTKVSTLILGLVVLVVGGLAAIAVVMTSRQLERRAEETLAVSARSVVDLVEIFRDDLQRDAQRSARTLAGSYPEAFTLEPGTTVVVAGTATPVLKQGGRVLNLDSSIPDAFTKSSGVTATIFVRKGDDFVRISTSLRKENGERALGTALDRAHPGYPLLREGKPFTGVATLFGRKYSTHYEPIRDARGEVIGVLYVGVDFTEELKKLQAKIAALHVGVGGGFSVLDGKQGSKTYGELLADPTRPGTNVLDEQDAAGAPIFRRMLEQQNGRLQFRDAKSGTEELAVFRSFPGWSWIVVARLPLREVTAEIAAATRFYAVGALVAIAAIVAVVFGVVRRLVSRPLALANAAAQRLAAGDLTVRLETERVDEIGQLLVAINGISEGLTMLVREVSESTSDVVGATDAIAAGNGDLSARTEQQRGALERSAEAIEQLAGTVRESAEHASHADGVAAEAAAVAERGNAVMARLLQTMREVERTSARVADITSVIDGIAFQTNILALNASVEAARAGEQGRGFAVVASEVRSLAAQSAAASRDIKQLIDASVAGIGTGTRQATEAGGAIGEVVGSVREMSGMVRRIRDAMQEQRAGIDSVNTEIAQITAATRENASVVERATTSADSLHSRAEMLASTVGVFKVAA